MIYVPKINDTVVLNNAGLEQIYGTTVGLNPMKKIEMKIVEIEEMSTGVIWAVSVDNKEINKFLLSNSCFDLVKQIGK